MTATNASLSMYFTLNLPIRKLSAPIIEPHFFAASLKSLRHLPHRRKELHAACRAPAKMNWGLWNFTYSANSRQDCSRPDGRWVPHLCF